MGLSSLIRQVRPEDLEKLPTRQKNMAKVEEYLTAYGLHLQGLSQRGVQSELGHKHLRTTQNQIKRGEEIAKKLGLDTERLKLKLAAAFEQLAEISIQQVKDQVENGRVTLVQDSEGRQEIRNQKGLDPRMLGEAGRGLIRFAQFAGLMDADKSTGGSGEISTNVVFVNPQADLSEWEPKTVNVASSDHKSDHDYVDVSAKASPELNRPTARDTIDDPEGPAGQGSVQVVQRRLI